MLALLRQREAAPAAPPNCSPVATTAPQDRALLLAAGALGYHLLLICTRPLFSRVRDHPQALSAAAPVRAPAPSRPPSFQTGAAHAAFLCSLLHIPNICLQFLLQGGSRSISKGSPGKPSLPPAHRPLAIIDKHAALVPPLVLPGSASGKSDLIAASPGRSSTAGTPHSRRSEGSRRQQPQLQPQLAQQQLWAQQRAAEREQLAAATQTIAQLQQQMDAVCR